MDNQQGPTVEHRELCSVLCGSLDGRGVWGRMDIHMGFQGGASGKEFVCRCRRRKRHGFDPWVGKSPWRREWHLTPVFLPENSMRYIYMYG